MRSIHSWAYFTAAVNDCRTHYFQRPHREDPEEGKRLENPGRSSINTSDDDGQRGHEEKGREYDVRGKEYDVGRLLDALEEGNGDANPKSVFLFFSVGRVLGRGGREQLRFPSLAG